MNYTLLQLETKACSFWLVVMLLSRPEAFCVNIS